MASVPYSLRPRLGDDPTEVTPDQLASLIGSAETQQAEWKSEIEGNDKAKRDLASDVAGFANATGGLMVVGLGEGAGSVATEYVGVNLADGLVDRIHSVIRDRVHPPVPYSVHEVPGPGGVDVVLVAVDPSEAAPHAVLNDKWLRYPLRSGTGKRYLSEAEVAEWYGQRLRRIAGQDARTAALRAAAVDNEMLEGDRAWVVVTLAPARVGTDRLAQQDVETYREVLSHRNLRPWADQIHGIWLPAIGHRAIVAGDGQHDPPRRAVLAVDGSGLIASRWDGKSDGHVTAYQRWVAREIYWSLSTLVANAVHRGVGGTATLSVEVVTRPTITVAIKDEYDSFPAQFREDRPHRGSTPVSLRTIDVDAIAAGATAQLAATHLLAVDLLSVFGHAAVPGISAAGAVRPAGLLGKERTQVVARWAAQLGIETVQ